MREFFNLRRSDLLSPARLWGRVVLWCAVIALLSAVPNTSGRQPDFETLAGMMEFLARKAAHLTEYALLMILVFRAAEGSWKEQSRPAEGPSGASRQDSQRRLHFLFAFFFVLLYAASDEWHQTFVFGRSGSAADVFIDAVGALGGYAGWLRRI